MLNLHIQTILFTDIRPSFADFERKCVKLDVSDVLLTKDGCLMLIMPPFPFLSKPLTRFTKSKILLSYLFSPK
jgi:hypothetical protein